MPDSVQGKDSLTEAMNPMFQQALQKVVDGQHLSVDEAVGVMTIIMDGQATPIQIAALLAALRTKGETVDEIAGFATVMRSKALRIAPRRRPLLDTCGTGGDLMKTFNVSTAAAFVIAAAGVGVAKHGNRAVTSQCGSADVLEMLGINLHISPNVVTECIDTIGIGFLYAPQHHPAMKHAAQPRREMGIRTVFNLLGPLTNPAGATRQIVGVYDPELCPRVAEVLSRLGCERALIFHGMEGLDEISVVGPTRISHLINGIVHTETRLPNEFAIMPALPDELKPADTPEENAEIIRAILSGEHGARRDIVVVNAAAGLIVAGMAESWRDGVYVANRMIDTGKALNILEDLVDFIQQEAVV